MRLCVVVLGGVLLAGCAQQRAREVPAQAPSAQSRDRAREHVKAGHQAFGAQDFERAVEEYRAGVVGGADSPLVHFRYGYALHVTGHPEEALPHHLRAMEIDSPALRVDALYNAACACALLDRREEALLWLSKAIDAGFRDLQQLRQDNDLDSLRQDPAFGELVARTERAASDAAR